MASRKSSDITAAIGCSFYIMRIGYANHITNKTAGWKSLTGAPTCCFCIEYRVCMRRRERSEPISSGRIQPYDAFFLLIVICLVASLMAAGMLHMSLWIIGIIMRHQSRIGVSFMMIVKEELNKLPFRRSKHNISREDISAFQLLLASPFVAIRAFYLYRFA